MMRKASPGRGLMVRVVLNRKVGTLVEFARSYRLSPDLVYKRWHKTGRPAQVTEHLFRPKEEKKPTIPRSILVDGVEHNLHAVSLEHGVTIQQLFRWRKEKNSITTAELKAMAERYEVSQRFKSRAKDKDGKTNEEWSSLSRDKNTGAAISSNHEFYTTTGLMNNRQPYGILSI